MAGRGKKNGPKMKKTGKDVRSKKYRPQDPERLGTLTTTRACHNAAPFDDRDSRDVPRMPGRACIPADDEVPGARAAPKKKASGAAVYSAAAHGGARGAAAVKAQGQPEQGGKGEDGGKARHREPGLSAKQAKILAKKRKAAGIEALLEARPPGGATGEAPPASPALAKRRKLRGAKAAKAGAGSDASDAASDAAGSEDGKDEARGVAEAPKASRNLLAIPARRPGETSREYRLRVDKAAGAALLEANKKGATDRQREKKRKARADRKQKLREKKKQGGKVGKSRGEKVVDFGNVVERPPILSSAAQKSRSKLKELAERKGTGGVAAAARKAETASEFADYAAKVREAYAGMKKKRLEEIKSLK